MTSEVRQWQCGKFVFQLDRPLIMGIINITPDSFSDGGQFTSADQAIAHGVQMLEEGADILDIGGESTRPNASPVDADTEKYRVLPVIEQLAKQGAAVSADTMKPEVMKSALASGACILNDVCGFGSKESVAVAANSDCGTVIMHMKGKPQTMQQNPHYDDVVQEVANFLKERAQALIGAGVAESRICLDPGIGFGKSLEHNTTLLRNLPQLAAGHPMLVGVSRKSWLGAISGCENAEDRDPISAVCSAFLSFKGAHILRVHNPAMTKGAVTVAKEFQWAWDNTGADGKSSTRINSQREGR